MHQIMDLLDTRITLLNFALFLTFLNHWMNFIVLILIEFKKVEIILNVKFSGKIT